ncbi:MAG: hypothetical protein WCR30_00670 [Clostridia bacterium]
MDKIFDDRLMFSVLGALSKKNRQSKMLEEFLKKVPEIVVEEINEKKDFIEFGNWKAVLDNNKGLNLRHFKVDRKRNKEIVELSISKNIDSIPALKEKSIKEPIRLNLVKFTLTNTSFDGIKKTNEFNWILNCEKGKFKVGFGKKSVISKCEPAKIFGDKTL